MKALSYLLVALLAAAFSTLMLLVGTLLAAADARADDTLASPSVNGPVLRTCDHDAGAVCSITWNGKQFINDYDHGRQLQSAVSVDGRGENENPTEAGASYLTNGLNPAPSSSVLLAHDVTRGVLSTTNRPAYWFLVNGRATSDWLIVKRLQWGFPHPETRATAFPNVLQYEVAFTVPAVEHRARAQFEFLTGYVPPEFSQFWTVGPAGAAPLTDGPGEQGAPAVFSTLDRQYAIGIYTPDLHGGGYGRWRFHDVMKFNVVSRYDAPVGTYRFKAYVVIGTLESVTSDIQMLANTKGVL